MYNNRSIKRLMLNFLAEAHDYLRAGTLIDLEMARINLGVIRLMRIEYHYWECL